MVWRTVTAEDAEPGRTGAPQPAVEGHRWSSGEEEREWPSGADGIEACRVLTAAVALGCHSLPGHGDRHGRSAEEAEEDECSIEAAVASGSVVQVVVNCWEASVGALRSCGEAVEVPVVHENYAVTMADASHYEAAFAGADTGEGAGPEAGPEAASQLASREQQWVVPAVAAEAAAEPES